jgi:hypothetical protein
MEKITLRDVLKHDGDRVDIEIVGKEPDVPKTFQGITKTITPFKVLVAGKTYIWEANQDHKTKLNEAGCGKKFSVVAFKTNKGFIAHNFVPSGDSTLNYVDTQMVTPPKFEPQGLGQCLNLAAVAYGPRGENQTTEQWFAELQKLALTLAPLQKAFVSGEPVKTPIMPKNVPTEDFATDFVFDNE